MEEEEARKIHQRMMSELENVDLDNELFIVSYSAKIIMVKYVLIFTLFPYRVLKKKKL